MADVVFQQLSTVNSNEQPTPPTIPATSTVAPYTFLTFYTGSTSIANIIPPVTGAHMLCFIFTSAPGVFATSGNIKSALQPVTNVPVFLVYDPVTALYWPGRLVSP
jgi:hypothetical protein